MEKVVNFSYPILSAGTILVVPREKRKLARKVKVLDENYNVKPNNTIYFSIKVGEQDTISTCIFPEYYAYNGYALINCTISDLKGVDPTKNGLKLGTSNDTLSLNNIEYNPTNLLNGNTLLSGRNIITESNKTDYICHVSLPIMETDINTESNTIIKTDIKTESNTIIETYINSDTSIDTSFNINENGNNNTNNDININNIKNSNNGISTGALIGIISGVMAIIIIIIIIIIARNKCISKKVVFPQEDINKTEANSMVDISKMIEVIFEVSTGNSKKVAIEGEKTMSDLIKGYFDLIEKPQLFNRSDSICFLYNAKKIDFNSKETINNFFGNINTYKILVVDTNNLIGSNDSSNKTNFKMIEVVFENMNQEKKKISIEKGKTMKELFITYFQLFNSLKNKEKIIFIYKDNIINFNNKEKVENFIGNLNELPIIYVSSI